MNIRNKDENIKINSRHEQAMVLGKFQAAKPIVEMQIYAVCAEDNIPEIWGNEAAKILCVQGHPEDLAAEGNTEMQNLYNWIADKAETYKLSHSQFSQP